MNLNKTKKLMDEKLDSIFFDSYAILVGIDGNEKLITSPNVNADTYFDIASIGKVLVTSPLILRAAGEGKLSLDDTIDKFFDDVPQEKQHITIQQLLTHTSGIIRVEIAKEIINKGKPEITKYILSQPLAFTPGSNYRYSCCAYILLGFIAEKVFGQPLDVLYDKYIKAPLELTRSRFNIPADEPNAVVCHYRAEAGDCMVADSIVYNMNGIAGNGASFWTVNDIRKYILSVLEKKPLMYDKKYFELSERNYTPNYAEGRGLGYLVVDKNYKQTGRLFPVGSFGHCGNTGTSFFINRENGLYVILLTNATRYSYMRREYKSCDYNETMQMREEIHNAIYDDLSNQGIIRY